MLRALTLSSGTITQSGDLDATYAPIAKGVTNGDSHDHSGGDGAQIDHGGLAGLTDDDHTQYLLADGTRAVTGNMTINTQMDGTFSNVLAFAAAQG